MACVDNGIVRIELVFCWHFSLEIRQIISAHLPANWLLNLLLPDGASNPSVTIVNIAHRMLLGRTLSFGLTFQNMRNVHVGGSLAAGTVRFAYGQGSYLELVYPLKVLKVPHPNGEY